MEQGGKKMAFNLRAAAAAALLISISASGTAFAQKRGGILRMYTPDSPAGMSIHEEATVFAQGPMMGVFNNLIMFDQHVPQNSLEAIVPDLATGWSWNEDGTELTFPLRQGVKWHDGKPFTAADVKCTWELLLEQSSEKFRVNPRKTSYKNLERVTTNVTTKLPFI
jgi:peptide/nickel transport system substrate-binding protein